MNDYEEKKLMDSVENGEWKRVANFEQLKKKFEFSASQTALKDFRMNIRISKKDVELLKTKALQEGIPYQTFAASILHKYVSQTV